jgi:hypothetical protein
VKFVGFWEYCLEDTDKVVEKFRQVTAEREKGTTRFAKVIFGPFHLSGESKGFTVFETDDPDALTNTAMFYVPVMKWKFVPIHESAKAAELWLKMKK